MVLNIIYTSARTEDLPAILQLQKENLRLALTKSEQKEEGFVTIQHDLPLLKKMNSPYPHTIAVRGREVVAYALTMLPDLCEDVSFLRPMFDHIAQLKYQDIPIIQSRYVVMGQICIAKDCRGKGVFAGLYNKIRDTLSDQFDWIITEISEANQRSLKAHNRQGFRSIACHQIGSESWHVVLWDWT